MIRLTKGETNELLNNISEDKQVYGLIFKLIYIYGKEGMTVLSLKWEQIDFKNNLIWFKNRSYPLVSFVRDDLVELSEQGTDGYVFLDVDVGEDISNSVDILRKKLRYYMSNTVKKLDVTHKVKHVALSITDLRKLRGQHLLLDGVSLKVVMDLYNQQLGTSTQFKKYLEYDDIMSALFPCRNLDELFNVYTNLNVFDFENPNDVDSFMVSTIPSEDENTDTGVVEFVIYLTGDSVGFVGEDIPSNVIDIVNSLFDCGLLDCLGVLKVNEYVVFDGLSFVKI